MKKPGFLIFILCLISFLYSTVPYNTNPDWISSDYTNYSTGAAWSDLNLDGYPDLVISNGNDMGRQHLVVYMNSASGLSNTISWQSSDIDYHGHLDCGDVNNDGFPDVVVSVYIGESGFSSPGKVKLYLNQNGTLNSLPDWVSQDSFYTFSLKLVDLNLDARLDLAVATGEAYYEHPDSNRVYYNINGNLENLPSWKSNRMDCSYDVNTADFDNNGFPDLVFVNENQSNQIYYNYNGILSSTAEWNASDSNNSANSLSIGDINNDGFTDLAVSDNSQMAGSGHFKIYQNNNGVMSSSPVWISDFDDYGSGIELFNNSDTNYDWLIAGGWWTPLYIYENNQSVFNVQSQWTSETGSVVEKIAFSDCNRDGEIVSNLVLNQDISRLIRLPHKHICRVNTIQANSVNLNLNQYVCDLENGVIYLGINTDTIQTLSIEYIWSQKLDFAISNWGNYPNYVFFFDNTIPIENETEKPEHVLSAFTYPNPVYTDSHNKICTSIKAKQPLTVEIDLFNVKGQKLRSITKSRLNQGKNEVIWNNLKDNELTSGIYLVRIRSNSTSILHKVVILE